MTPIGMKSCFFDIKIVPSHVSVISHSQMFHLSSSLSLSPPYSSVLSQQCYQIGRFVAVWATFRCQLQHLFGQNRPKTFQLHKHHFNLVKSALAILENNWATFYRNQLVTLLSSHTLSYSHSLIHYLFLTYRRHMFSHPLSHSPLQSHF